MLEANAPRSVARAQIVFLTFGLHRQLGYLIQAAAWFGIWFGLVSVPLGWAHDSSAWNSSAGQRVWSDKFENVHHYVWRVLLVFMLLRAMGLLRAAAGKWCAFSLPTSTPPSFFQLVHYKLARLRSGMPSRRRDRPPPLRAGSRCSAAAYLHTGLSVEQSLPPRAGSRCFSTTRTTSSACRRAAAARLCAAF